MRAADHCYQTIIVGTGFSGICMAIQLQQAGITDIIMLEKADGPGGTWRDNIYPGAACDVPSALYSFSFEHNSAWAYKWSRQDQILDYQQNIIARHNLAPLMRFGAAVKSATWHEEDRHWRLETVKGDVFYCRHFITAVGQLHHPKTPDIAGIDRFQGPKMHTARWNPDVDPAGKTIAVIGNAASAVQLVPELVKSAHKVTIFQRSANWILPKLDRAYMPWEQELSAKFPVLAQAYRWRLWMMSEAFLYQVMRGRPWARWLATRLANWWRDRSLADPNLRDSQHPNYAIGAKRVLFTDDWYTALQAENCDLETTAIATITEKGIETSDGRFCAADALVFATGFHTHPFFKDITITGAKGIDLQQHWHQGSHAWMGMMTRHFPNMFMLYGPNTNLGHTSILLMIEAQAAWIARALKAATPDARLEVKEDAEDRFDQEMQQRLAKMAWASIGDSWYLDAGRNVNNWPGSTREYMRRCNGMALEAIEVS